jgi:5-methylcytosine-specific restriction protein A
MPMMPSHRCSTCGTRVTGRCPVCAQQRDTRRGSAASRGYCSARWRRFRLHQLGLHPFCAICQVAGRFTAATEVDHVVPVDGPDDPRFLAFAAVQSVCHRCHSIKTATQDSTFTKRGAEG